MKKYLLIFSLSIGATLATYLKVVIEDYTRLIFCDVGQGDAILIEHGFTQVLIDGGPDQQILSCLGEYIPWFDRKIELVVITHPDTDHIGGLHDVFLGYNVQRILRSEEQKLTTVFNDLERLIKAEKIDGLSEFRPLNGQSFSFDDNSKISVISIFSEDMLQDPDAISYYQSLSTNNQSIGLLYECGADKALLMADIEEEIERAMIDKRLLMDVNILKVAHHGSKSSTSIDLVNVTAPETSIISVGKDNRFGHPSLEVISRLIDHGSTIYRTDHDGDISFICNKGKLVLIDGK